jgi:hypothetical protein
MAIPATYVAQGVILLPALTPLESAIAIAWLREHIDEYDSVEFNVRLGSGIELPPGTAAEVALWARLATTKRADMILLSGRDATIVEVKIRIGASALGQLLLYRKLYIAAHPEVQRLFLIAAGQTIEPDVLELYGEHKITVELFPNVRAH